MNSQVATATRFEKESAHALSSIASNLERLTARTLRYAESSAPTIYEHYKVFREYAEHEDDLINNRLLWNINIQGFLFATYGFSLQKLAEVQMHQGTEIIGAKAMYWLLGVLPLFGAAVSFLSWKGVVAAQRAIAVLDKQWGCLLTQRYQSEKLMVPTLIGGGDPKAHKWGFLAPWWFPWIVIAAWGILFLSYGGFLLYYLTLGG